MFDCTSLDVNKGAPYTVPDTKYVVYVQKYCKRLKRYFSLYSIFHALELFLILEPDVIL